MKNQECDKIIIFFLILLGVVFSMMIGWNDIKVYGMLKPVMMKRVKQKGKKERKNCRNKSMIIYIKYLRVYLQNINVNNAHVWLPWRERIANLHPQQNIDVNDYIYISDKIWNTQSLSIKNVKNDKMKRNKLTVCIDIFLSSWWYITIYFTNTRVSIKKSPFKDNNSALNIGELYVM